MLRYHLPTTLTTWSFCAMKLRTSLSLLAVATLTCASASHAGPFGEAIGAVGDAVNYVGETVGDTATAVGKNVKNTAQ